MRKSKQIHDYKTYNKERDIKIIEFIINVNCK